AERDAVFLPDLLAEDGDDRNPPAGPRPPLQDLGTGELRAFDDAAFPQALVNNACAVRSFRTQHDAAVRKLHDQLVDGFNPPILGDAHRAVGEPLALDFVANTFEVRETGCMRVRVQAFE